MNILLLVSGLFAAFATVGHFVIGSKQYLKPVLEAPGDQVAKKVMHAVFHYISVNLVLSSLLLLALGFGARLTSDVTFLVRFVALHYVLYAVVQIIIAVTSTIENRLFKMFQWVLWILIAVFALLGA